MLFVLTGASGSGKTAIRSAVEARLPELVWQEFDSVGVPRDADAKWRQRTLADWITVAIGEQSRRRDMILSGQVALGEILASPPAPYLRGLAVCLLDCDDIARIRRLRVRRNEPDQDMLNWAAWLRVHSSDPTWRPDVIQDHGAEESQWSRWADWESNDARWSAHRINTTALTIVEVAAQVVAWVVAAGQDRSNPVAAFAT